MLAAWFVDSWRRVDNQFILFKIVLRREVDGAQWSVEHRYSELLLFHEEVSEKSEKTLY